MDEEAYDDLLGFVHDRAGDAFRTAFSYHGNDWEPLYVRKDVATEELERTVSSLLGRAKRNNPIIEDDTYDRIGAYQATVELYEKGVLLHFRESERSGVVVSLDREAARDLTTFIHRCYSTIGT